MRIVISDLPLDSAVMFSAFEAANLQSGALSSFVGRCRAKAFDGGTVEALELQHYPGFTERIVQTFTTELSARLMLNDALVVHRVGRILPGEAIVLVAAAAPHRAAALQAVATLIDFLKTQAPFWKREVSETQSTWIEPTALDHHRARKIGGKP